MSYYKLLQIKIKIIVVDDQGDMRILTNMILTQKGYEVATFATRDSIRKLDIEPDLMLLGVDLGSEDGRYLCKALKKNPSTKKIPIILVSTIANLSQIYFLFGAEHHLRNHSVRLISLKKFKDLFTPLNIFAIPFNFQSIIKVLSFILNSGLKSFDRTR